MRLIDFSQIITPEDWHDMSRSEREGAEGFAKGSPLAIMERHDDPAGDDWRRGWWRGWAVCYAMGVKAFLTGPAAGVDLCPFPQFSGAWEAWGEGWNTARRLPGSGEPIPC